jgi:hypothetical protein
VGVSHPLKSPWKWWVVGDDFYFLNLYSDALCSLNLCNDVCSSPCVYYIPRQRQHENSCRYLIFPNYKRKTIHKASIFSTDYWRLATRKDDIQMKSKCLILKNISSIFYQLNCHSHHIFLCAHFLHLLLFLIFSFLNYSLTPNS